VVEDVAELLIVEPKKRQVWMMEESGSDTMSSDGIMISKLQITASVPDLYIQRVQEIYNHQTNWNRIKIYLLSWLGLGLVQDSNTCTDT
jgi:hypothetical protein